MKIKTTQHLLQIVPSPYLAQKAFEANEINMYEYRQLLRYFESKKQSR